MPSQLRYLLLQIRNADDPMRDQEIVCFARALEEETSQFEVGDLLSEAPSAARLGRVDVVLLGGSGHYSAAGSGPWLDRSMECLRGLYELSKPTFASCWGFQAMARALGGEVIHDISSAELGTHRVRVTEAGRRDPVFGPLGEAFDVQMGHADCVSRLPPGATLLASTDRNENQAYCLVDRPIYCTQFHPELSRSDIMRRIEIYPDYAERITGQTFEEFAASLRETTECESLLRRFVQHVFGD